MKVKQKKSTLLAKLEFDLRDEGARHDFFLACRASEMYCALNDIRQLLRQYRKYHQFDPGVSAAQFFSKLDWEMLELLPNCEPCD